MSVKDFLKQRAVNISVGGHYTLMNWFDAQGRPSTFACRTSRVSPFRMLVAVPVVGKVGDRVTSYFGDFGKLDGLISDITARGFLRELAMAQPKREKLSSKLDWLEKKQKNPSVPDGRRHVRIIPANPHSTLTFADGSARGCFVIDMSMSGASVSSDVQPQIGSRSLSEPASAASSGSYPTASPSSSSSGRPATILNGASSDPHRFPQAVRRPHLGPTKQSRRSPSATQRQLRSAQQSVARRSASPARIRATTA